MNAFKYYKELPAWAKGVVIVGGLGITYFTGLTAYKMVKRGIEKGKSAKSLKNVAAEKSELADSGQVATYQPSQYKGWADSIQKQFSGCDFSVPVPFTPGLDLSYSGKVLYNVLSGFKNDLDFLNLIESFGVRTYDDCGWGTGDVENVTLYSAVTDELNSDEIKEINKLLKSKGITYTF